MDGMDVVEIFRDGTCYSIYKKATVCFKECFLGSGGSLAYLMVVATYPSCICTQAQGLRLPNVRISLPALRNIDHCQVFFSPFFTTNFMSLRYIAEYLTSIS